ncbi:MAG TPA: lipid II flippase MurJ [Acidimicrobiales bacterium]|nr:lipid II flippase MurJ [Acidimicrobiales bacterium]
MIAIAAALGATFLGNTYQSANLVSNLLFELLAAGVLSSVLVPPFVEMLDAGRRDDAEEVAGGLLGMGLVVLGVVCLIGVVARTWIMQALTVAVPDPAVRAAEIRLGSFFLILFVPQVLLYAVGTVATALLHGARRFSAVAFAPVANNVIVIATMGVFWAVSGGRSGVVEGVAGLDLSTAQKLVLAGGTTAGVAAMSLVPLVAVWRSGIRLRPRWAPRHPQIRALARAGGWGAAYLALSQVLVATTLVLANQVEGGVVAYQIAFTLFLLPHALLAQPLITVLYPRLAAEASSRQWRNFSETLAKGGRWVIFLTAPAAAFLVAAVAPALQIGRVGRLDAAGTDLVASVAVGYALGIVGYAGFLLATRASYAAADTRTPALVNLGVTVGGSVLMIGLFFGASGSDRVVVLGFAYSSAVTVGAVLLLVLLRRRTGKASPMLAAVARATISSVAAGVAARAVVDAIPTGSRAGAATAVCLAAALAAAVYLASQWVLRSPELAQVPALVKNVVAGVGRQARSDDESHHRVLTRTGASEAVTRGPVVALVATKDGAATVGSTVAALRRVAHVDKVVVVDDGSTDSTTSVALAAGASVLRLTDNVGKGGALAAGMGAAPDARAYLLVDADVGESAAAAAGLLTPVLAGDADMTVGVLPPAGPGAGFGKVRALAAAGIRRATGRTVEAPLSGQRAVAGPLLRRLEPAPRFGLETGLTIDAVRAGARVVEVPVTMTHHEWGRGLSGLSHRAHQGADIVRALWPRLTSSGFRLGALVTAFVVTVGAVGWTGNRWEPSSVAGRPGTAKVVLVGIPGLSLGDLSSGQTPNLDALVNDGALAAMSVRTLSRRPSEVEGYATLGAGGRVKAPAGGANIVDASAGSIAINDAPHFRSVNNDSHISTFPGALGDALHGAGRRTAVIGSSDAAVAVMDRRGTVDSAALGAGDPLTIEGSVRDALLVADVVIVGTSGAEADGLVGTLATDLPAETLLLVAGVTPPAEEWRLTPLIAFGAGTRHGYLQSPSTKRLGLVTLTDVAPTVLDVLGVHVPSTMVGHALRYHAGEADPARLVRLDDDAAYRERIYFPIAMSFIAFQALAYLLTLFVLRRPGGARSRWGTLVRVVALAIAAFPLATFLLRAVPNVASLGDIAGGIIVCAIDALIVLVALGARHRPLSPLAWILATTVFLLLFDVATGGRLQVASVMGYSPQSAARFFGIGNTAFAVLAAASILVAALHVYHAPRRREAIVAVTLFLALVVLVDGAPGLGGDVGGILTLVPVFALMILSLVGVRLSWRVVAAVAGATVVVLTIAAGIDLLRPPEARTHLGRLVADTWTNGDSSLLTTIARKAETNVRVLRASVWTWTVPIIAVFMLFMLAGRRRAADLLPPGSPLRVGVVAALACGLLGFAVNDSGVVVTALVLTYVGPFLILVALAQPRDQMVVLEPETDAPATAVSAPAGATP